MFLPLEIRWQIWILRRGLLLRELHTELKQLVAEADEDTGQLGYLCFRLGQWERSSQFFSFIDWGRWTDLVGRDGAFIDTACNIGRKVYVFHNLYYSCAGDQSCGYKQVPEVRPASGFQIQRW